METTKVLVFVGTEGIYHDHLSHGKFLSALLSGADAMEATLSQDYEIFAGGLDRYEAVLSFTDVGELTEAQEKGLLGFIRQGGGLFGLHTAAASFRDNSGYHGMLNAYFDGHSRYMDFTVNIVDSDHPITNGISDFLVTDELYYLKHDPAQSHHLMQAYDPTKDETHVMGFTHTYGKGRVFYFALGHDMAVLRNPSFQEIVQRGIRWVASSEKE